MGRNIVVWASILFLTVFMPVRVAGQATGNILGVVLDPGGAVVPNAKVTATETGTNFTRSTVATGSGNYTLTLMPVGRYRVTAEASGFQPASIELTLDVNQKREANFTLALSGVQTKVDVTAVAPAINTTTAALGGLVEGKQVQLLPLNGRDITNLVLLQPGVQMEPNSSFAFNNYYSGNGNRGTTNSSSMDGLDTSDNELGGVQFSNFNLDAIDEFRVLQNSYSAEYGRGSGTVVQMVTKSGTNQLHGSAFEFLRNNKLDARNFFDAGTTPLRRNEYGGTIGGPVWIPKVYNGRDKTFFFFQMAGFRQRRADPVLFAVPTADERQGLVDLTDSSGNVIDQLRVPVLPEVSAVLNKYPTANAPNGPFGARTFRGNASIPINRDQYSGRLDQRFSDRDSLFLRVSFSYNSQPSTNAVAQILDPTFPTGLTNDWKNAGLSETHVFSPTLLNHLTIGVNQTKQFIGPKRTDLTQATFADGAIQSYGPDSAAFSLAPLSRSLADTVTWVHGKHTFTFGGEFRDVRGSYFGASVGGPAGFFNFASGTPLPVAVPSVSGTNDFAAGAPSPSSLVSFMTGRSLFYQRSIAYPGFGPSTGGYAPFTLLRWHAYGFFQDDYKISRSLTANFGLRYEYNSVPRESAGRMTGIIDSPNFLGQELYGRMVLNPSPIYREDYRGYGPRLGLAWHPVSKTVFRSGFGIFTNLPLSQTADQQGFGFPYAGTSSSPGLMFSPTPQSVAGLPPIRDLHGDIVPPGGDTHSIAPNTPIDLAPFGPLLINLTSTNFHNGYTISANASVERELGWDTSLQASWVTNNAVGLYASAWPNCYVGCDPALTPFSRITPGLSEFQLTDNHAHSTYHALQAVLRKSSPSHGLAFQASYTFSKAIDNATTVFNGPAVESDITQQNPFCWSCEKSRSSFDFPHRVVVNFSYRLPLANVQALPKRLADGWTLMGIVSAQSGFPFTITSPYGTKRYGIDQYIGYQPTRPDLIQNPAMRPAGQGPDEQFFSSDTINDAVNFGGKYFGVPLDHLDDGTLVQATPGNLGRNAFRSAAFSNTDFSILKDTRLWESGTLQFRSEFFNIFNQHAFNAPGRQLGSPDFGVATSTVLASREIQFGLRLVF